MTENTTVLKLEDMDVIELTVAEVRNLLDESDVEILPLDLTSALDKAQGDVHTEQQSEVYIVIRVSA